MSLLMCYKIDSLRLMAVQQRHGINSLKEYLMHYDVALTTFITITLMHKFYSQITIIPC